MDSNRLSFVSLAAFVGWLVGRSMGLAAGGTAINAGPVAAVIFAGIAAILLFKLPLEKRGPSGTKLRLVAMTSEGGSSKLMRDSLSATGDLAAGAAMVLRILWNLEMSILAGIGLMVILRRWVWPFLLVGFVLLYFWLPIGLLFGATAFAAVAREPLAGNDYIVPVR